MDRQTVLEYLRLVLIAFVIAFVINIFRVAIFTDWNNEPRFQNITEPEQTPQEVRNSMRENDYQPQTQTEFSINQDIGNEILEIPMHQRENFSGLSKSRILEKRMDAIRTSLLFSQMDYTPSNDVFKIDDGLPWISMNAALHWSNISVSQRGNGVSRDSIGIVNPELLYYVDVGEDKGNSLYGDYDFMPYKVTYNKNTNTISSYFRNYRNENAKIQEICLADTNAHDLGFKFAYMDKYKNIGFYTDEPYKNNTLASNIKEITGYYMHGSACGMPGGCNNYAPYWQYYNYFYLNDLPANVHIKLWKNKPNSPEQRADINYEMIFE